MRDQTKLKKKKRTHNMGLCASLAGRRQHQQQFTIQLRLGLETLFVMGQAKKTRDKTKILEKKLMTDRIFIEDQDLVKKMLNRLTPLSESSGWQCEHFIDKTTNQKWEKYLFELFDADDDGIRLRRYPYPSIEEIIKVALTSNYFDEIDGASGLLLDMEYDKMEFRDLLLSEIEKNIYDINEDRFEIIYNRAEYMTHQTRERY